MLERVRLRPSAGEIEQLTEKDHGRVGLARSGGPGDDDGLGVSGLALEADGLGDDASELRTCRRVGGGVEGQRVAHVEVGVHRENDRSYVRLQREKSCSTEFNVPPGCEPIRVLNLHRTTRRLELYGFKLFWVHVFFPTTTFMRNENVNIKV